MRLRCLVLPFEITGREEPGCPRVSLFLEKRHRDHTRGVPYVVRFSFHVTSDTLTSCFQLVVKATALGRVG